MTTPMTFDELCVACATKTDMSKEEWADFLSCPPDLQADIVKTYQDVASAPQWTKSRDVLSDVITTLEVAGTVAGAVTGIGSAVILLKGLL